MGDSDLAALLSRRPILVVLAGPNGAGKSTFYHAHLAFSGLRFINADVLARDLELDARQAADAAHALRSTLIQQGESFITETVFSDPVGAKLEQFVEAQKQGYTVVLLYIGVDSPARSDERVAMRVSQGGHDVPPDRIISRYPRILTNLRNALPVLSAVLVYDNNDLRQPFRQIARVIDGMITEEDANLPEWWHTVSKGREQ